MKILFSIQRRTEAGGALMLTMIMTGIALAVLAGAMTWSANTTRQTHRSIQYTKAVAAAEGATEKIVTMMSQDYLNGGDALVAANVSKYQKTVLKASDSSTWGGWEFADLAGAKNSTSVVLGATNKYIVLNSTYAGLKGYVSTYTVTSAARDKAASLAVYGGVSQEVQLARIPIFQFAMYSSADMEISCGQPLTVSGRVHSNKRLFVEPDNMLTFQSDVTAVLDVIFGRHPDEGTGRGGPKGGVVYVLQPDMPKSGVPAMILPIGTTNTPEAIREIILPPPAGESATSPLGRLRYYNQADLIITATDSNVLATSGVNLLMVNIPTNQVALFANTTNSFKDAREEKTVRPIDLDIGMLKLWSETNNTLRPQLGGLDLSSVYVVDKRKLPGTSLGAVRVKNGLALPSRGLTVATGRPLYVQGHFNQIKANLGKPDTSTTKPASLVGDAITILSANWLDSKSTLAVGSRTALPTTINAAFLTGVVESTKDKYSGGMENFPRFLETWGLANILTYNGSMVKMFPSLYATNAWGKADVYAPPKRDWAFDINFDNPAKIPPLTPSLVKVLRGKWSTVPANNLAKSTGP